LVRFGLGMYREWKKIEFPKGILGTWEQPY